MPDNNVKAFSPDVKLSVPPLSHVIWSADENVLVVTAGSDGGLIAYKTDDLLNNSTQPALQISTNGQALRALVPNPNTQFGELFALVTTNGELLIADLKAGQLRDGVNGKVLRSRVSCIAWSNQGKQLVAGLADSSVIQMTPDGAEKAQIPQSPNLQGEKHVSTLAWLANDVFFIVYTSSRASEGMLEPSDWFIILRQPRTQNYTFHPLPEVCPAFGLSREPACQFVARLRKFEPHLDDLLLLASTTSIELGLIAKADAPLSANAPNADSYALTLPADDARRAQLPLSLKEGDTSPIGLAVDLSATDSIVSPIPSDPEIEQSPGPLPNILALNHEGVLASWWIVYADAIRQKKSYPGLTALIAHSGQQQQQQQQSQPQQQSTSTPSQSISPSSRPTQPSFGQPSFTQPAFGQTAFRQPNFGQPSFGSQQPQTQGQGSAFGQSVSLGGDRPSWTSTGFSDTSAPTSASSSQPSFGASTQLGGVKPAFGAPSPFAARPIFGQPAAPVATATSTPTTAPSVDGQTKGANPFSGNTAAAPFGGETHASQGFSSFSSNSTGFATLGSQAAKPNPFGSNDTMKSLFGQSQEPQSFAAKSSAELSTNKQPNDTFSITSSFKPSETTTDSASAPSQPSALSMEPSLGDVLDATHSQATAVSTVKPQSPIIKEEQVPPPISPSLEQIPEAPLPPDPTSKPSYGSGDSTDASNDSKVVVEHAPLPPDFVPQKNGTPSESSSVGSLSDNGDDIASEPEDIDGDNTQEATPGEHSTVDAADEVQTSPESSFGKSNDFGQDDSPAGGLFTKVSTSKPPQLFGEVVSGPVLPPPVTQESPRSPSPIRSAAPGDVLRPEALRSVGTLSGPQTAPALDRRRADLVQSALGSQPMSGPRSSDAQDDRTATIERSQATAQEHVELKLGDDDEETKFRAELAAPVSPRERLEPFVSHPHADLAISNKAGIPGQIERLYRDINSMIDTVGINARSLSAFILYQTSPTSSQALSSALDPEALKTDLIPDGVLENVSRFREGQLTLYALLEKNQIDNVQEKFEECQSLLKKDLVQMRTKLASTRKELYDNTVRDQQQISLTAEQISVLHDLRKASMALQSKLGQAEQELVVLRGKVAEIKPPQAGKSGATISGPNKPTVEAVMSTISKMTSMAESKRTDIDVLNAQIRKLGLTSGDSPSQSRCTISKNSGTPKRESSRLGASSVLVTPKSTAGSTYYTPEAGTSQSIRSTPRCWRSSLRSSAESNVINPEEAAKWKARAQRKQTIDKMLRDALAGREKGS